MRHASFFSGVGGLDLGFEKAGIKTVSVCEIDPYASSVLAERFPDAPNLGSITEVRADDIPEADIWSGGFPCQDLSVAGKRAGFAGKRSSLAFTFLDLVEQRRPRWLLLENVPGLFTSNKGADFARLLHEVEQLGYSVAWRTLDARYFGVPQRRRRVFIVASLERDRAAEVLLECEGCERHPKPRWSQRKDVASHAKSSLGIDSLRATAGKSSAEVDANGMREVDGLARGVDDQPVLAYQTRVDEKNNNFTLNEVEIVNSLSAMWPADTSHRSMTLVQAYRKSARVTSAETPETWVEDGLANTLNSFDVGDVRTTHIVLGGEEIDDELLPLGLDSNRYRCCGNGVVSNVAEWIGHRLKLQHDNW